VIRSGALVLVLAAAALGGCGPRAGGGPQFSVAANASGDYRVPVASMLARKYNTVVRQQYDFSCGSAALATLLRYHYTLAQDEAAVFTGMWQGGDQAKIRQVGFSLLDMKRYLAAIGLSADGYKVSLDAVAKRGLPGIALITHKGYRHFVVVKGIAGDQMLIGDPSLGLHLVPRARFEEQWNGVYFVINSRSDIGQRHFNAIGQWQSFARAPVGAPFIDPLSQQALSLSAPFYRDF
jgi:uncharacterized protein